MVPDPDPTTALLRTVRRLARAEEALSRALARRTGLTLPQLLCLRAVAQPAESPPTLAQLARAVELSPATVTGIVDRLEARGWVRRARQDHDRRKIRVVLTAEGARRHAELPAVLDDRLSGALMELDDPERARLARALESVVHLLEEGAREAAAP